MSGPATHRGAFSEAPARRALRVLIVEDSENDAALLLRELRRGGYEPDYERVDTPEDMERALAGEPWELVISDYFMPRFRAPEALALLRKLGHDTPFIVVSGKVGEDLAVEAMRAGAQDYITKENMTRLNAAIERELREAEERRERRRAEEALSRSERRFQRLVEHAADAIFVYEPDGRFLDVNRRACESLGYTREELLQMSVPDIEVDYAPEELVEIRRRLTIGNPITIEGTHRRKDGATFPVEVRVGLLESEGRKLILTLVRDITERKEAERKIRETETRYKALVEQIPAVTYIQDPETKQLRYVSPQIEDILGYPPDREMLDDDHWIKIMHPEDRERVISEDERTDDTGEPFRMEYRQFARDGKMVWIRDQAILVRDEEGNPLYWQGVQYDITDQKRAEEDLRASEERYRTFISQSTEGIWRIELAEPLSLDLSDEEMIEHAYRHGYLAECNDAMARMYGYERAEDLVDTRLEDLLPLSEARNVDMLTRFARSGCRLTDAESREFDREGNARVFLNNLNGIVEGGMLVRIWGTQRDITERKLAEEELRRSENSLAEAQRIAHIGNWDYDMARDEAFWSDELYRIFGFAPGEFTPNYKSFLDLVHPDDRRIVRAEVRRAVYGGDHSSIDYRVVRPDGETRYVNTRYEVVRDETGQPVSLTGTIHDITERKKIEDALREAEEKYRGIFENSVEGIFQTTMDGRILTANPALARMLGYESPEEMVETVTDVSRQVYAERRQREEFLRVLRENETVSGFEIRALRKDGSEVLLSLNAHLVRDDTGEVVATEGSAENITERRRAEETLRESEERFRATFDQAAVGFLQVGLEGEWIRFNDKFCEIAGYSREELAEISVFDLISMEDFEEDFERGVQMLAGEIRDYTQEKIIVGKGGRRVWTNLTVSLVRDAADAPRYFIAVAEDISERKWAEEELRLRERAIDASINGIVLTDPNQPDNPIVYVNPAFERITGYSSTEVIGRNCRFMQGGDRDQPALRELRAAIRERRECRVVLKNYRKDGTPFWNELSISPVFDERRRLIRFVGVQDDITERRRVEEEQRLLAETGSVLASSLDYRTTLAGVANLAVPGFADWCAIDVVEEDGSLNRLAVAHEDPEKIALAHELQLRYPPDPESSVGALQVVRSGQSELYSEIPDEMLIAAARDEEHLKLIREIGFTAAIMVPLVARGRTLGVISLVSAESGRRYEAADLALAEELARRAALAVDNARLFEEAQREIAEREVAEQEMRNSRDQLDVILRGVTDGITAQDPTGRLIYANDAAARIAGYPSAQALVDAPLEEMLSRFEILDESGEPLPLSALPGRQALRGEPVQERTLCFYELATGEERWAVVGAAPIFDERGNVRLVVNIFRDVTEQRRAQEALQISEARFRTMIEQSPLSIQILTPHGRTLQVNRAWEELFGTDLEGLGDYNLLEDRQLVEQGVMPQILKGFAGEPVRIPPIAYNRYESIPELNQQDEPVLWTQAYVYPVKDAVGKVREVVLMHEDVSERRRAEEELIWLASFPMLNPNPIVETSLDGEPTYLNPAAEAQFPNVRTLGSRHPALADLRSAYERIWASGGRPMTREVRVGERFYQQTISRVPESDLLRIYTTDTTDRRRAEEAVRKSEERFRSLVQNASDIIVVLDASGEILYESPAIERVLAYTPEERIGTSAFDYIHPEDQERVRDSFAKYIEDSEVHAAVEYRVRARDGSWHYFEAVGTNLLDDPAVGGIVVNTRDVTERRVAEETLRESEERFRATFDQAAVGVAIVGLDGNWLRVNDKLLGIVGYTSDEMRGLTFQDITHPGDLEDDLRGMRRMLEGEISTYTREKRYFKKDGSVVWINLTVSLVRDNSGEPGYFIAVIEDIGQRKEAEVALRISEEKYRTLFETMTQGVVYQDAGGRIISANSAAERILGMTLEQMQGKTSTDPWWRAIHEDGSDYPGEEHPIVRALKTGREVRNDVIGVFVPETGEYRWVNVNAVPQFREEEDTPYQAYAVFEDITERRRAEEQIRSRAREQEAVADIGRRALARGDLQTLMDYAVSRIAEVLDLDCCGILELLPDSGSMLLRSGVGWEEGRVGEATVSADPGSQGGYTLALDEPVIVEDLRAETRFEGSRLLRDHGVVSGMSVIIRGRERPFGLLGAYVREQRVFDDDDVNFLRVIANMLATAIERRSVETALIQSEELYRTVVEQAAENIFVVDVETKEVLEANAALGRSLGYTEEEIRSMTLYDIVDHERESIDERVERILALGRDFLGERVYRRKDGTSVDVEVSASAIPYRGRNAMCIVAHDITERKRIEAAMREVREAERNRIARDLHDDILQDMVYALQEIQILQVTSEDGGAPALEDTAAALRRSVEGLRVAVFELRLSETLERSLLASMQALLELNRRMVRNRYTIDMSISEDFPQELPERKGKELVRIIQEALSNARRHASPNHVQIELGLDGETAWAEVTDDGAGFTITGSGGGVGMSSMRQRALELGGEVRVESEPGHGARMRFEVPLERLTAE